MSMDCFAQQFLASGACQRKKEKRSIRKSWRLPFRKLLKRSEKLAVKKRFLWTMFCTGEIIFGERGAFSKYFQEQNSFLAKSGA